MRHLYLAATGQNRGKTTVSLGVMDGFTRRGLSTGFCKPVGQRTVIQDGVRKTYTLDRTKDNLLDAGLAAGIELPYSCKGGVCSTCRCKLVEGEVDMDVNFALEDYEVARGFILACQSYPATDKVVVDFDQTGMG